MNDFREIFELPRRLFALGDLHGCSAELALMLAALEKGEQFSGEDILVCIGDYIDRGPDTKGVIEQLLAFKKRFPRTIFLKGNHEDMLMSYLAFTGNQGGAYLQNGGVPTLRSYGLPESMEPEAVLDTLPPEHVEFLQGLERYVIIGQFVFAHAGLHPLRELRAQVDEDLFWIRDEFINNLHHFDRTVVFGHTPFEDILVHMPWKVGIDTGVVFGNKLSCIELIGATVFQVEAGGTSVERRSLLSAES